MAYGGQVVGPGGSSKSAKGTDCQSIGPGGVSSDVSVTTRRGYDSAKTSGLRKEYKESGRAMDSKA